MIPYGRHSVSPEDVEAVREVLSSDFLTQGPQTPAFEREVAEHCRAAHACAVNSATSALHLTCLSLGLGPGDWLWTSPVTFVSSANCALHCGARVDFVDVEPDTANLSVERLEEKLERADKAGRLPKIIMPVHLAGQSCDVRGVHHLAERYGCRVVEDASHAVGGDYLDEPVGSCRYSDAAVFSFHPVKIITTGEGGMALTQSPRLAEQMHLLRSHGVTREPEKMTRAPDGPWYYQQIALGFNYRMTDIQAALGRSQLRRLDRFVARRRALAERYDELLGDLPVQPLRQRPFARSSRHLYIIRVEAPRRDEVFASLRRAGVGVNLHYIPVHTQPYYRQKGFADGDFPAAEAYYREALSLPLYPDLDEDHQDAVVAALKEALKEAPA